ncbi:MAG: L-seryl-tRNA(Sec) selenium transferase [Planctomycetota bacterium]
MLRTLPSVDAVLGDVATEGLFAGIPRAVLVDSIRRAIDRMRKALTDADTGEIDKQGIYRTIVSDSKCLIAEAMRPYYRRVVNATGIILHTGLGRAVLADKALKQIEDELSGYSLLQVDAGTGKRSKRESGIEGLLQKLTGAEAATVVNNNAVATAIVLNTFAKDKEVIVSRGQLVEIGGSFRLPDVMSFSGAKMVEVGTTNKTHARDYEKAITENTAALLRVHPSNYKIRGFTSEVSLEELVAIAHARDLVMIDDVGSGALFDFTRFGFEAEPTLPESIRKGADVVTCSADKLIGASQGGIILGKTKYIDAIRSNQFYRMLRVGKLTLAVLEATLKLFLDEAVALSEVPTLEMLTAELSELSKKADQLGQQLSQAVDKASVEVIDGFSQVGSGSMPDQNLPTSLVAISPKEMNAENLAGQLRQYSTPIFTRIQNERVLIDPRTLRDGDDKVIVAAVREILGGQSPG